MIAGVVMDSPPAVEARRQAQQILSQARFRGHALPHPFAGALRTLGRWLQPVGHPLISAYNAVVANTAGRWVAVGIAAIVGVAGGAYLIRRRSRASPAGPGTRPADEDVVGGLDSQADEAERDGKWELAYRLRFRAGVHRLEQRGVLQASDTLTTRQLVTAVGSPEFAALAEELQQIAYAGRPASPEQIDEGRARWTAVLSGGARR